MTADGVPTAVFYNPPTSPGRLRSSSVGGLSDETIEELFPPTDQELAELMLVDQYVELLAHLDALEESESYVTEDWLSTNFCRRWETRRKDRVASKAAKAKYASPAHKEGTVLNIDVEEIVLMKSLPKKGNRSPHEQGAMLDKGNAFRRGSKSSQDKSSMRQPLSRAQMA